MAKLICILLLAPNGPKHKKQKESEREKGKQRDCIKINGNYSIEN